MHLVSAYPSDIAIRRGARQQGAAFTVTTLAALKALKSRPSIVQNQYRSTVGDLGGGTWMFRTGNQSSNVTADPQSGLWAAPDSDSTGASGAWQRLFYGMVFPPWFGGRGFTTNAGVGTTDAIAGVLAAHQSGYPVDGGGLWYGITGSMRPITNFAGFVVDLKAKQLAPATSNVRTLFYDEVPNLYLRDIVVDCGGDPDAGDKDNCAGVWISGSTTINWKAIDVEVYNGGPITGILLNGLSKGQLERPVVRDFAYSLSPDPTDDVINGIFATGCTDVDITNPKVHDLTGTLLGVAGKIRYTRGIVRAGCTRVSVSNATVYNVDQGIDNTGNGANVECGTYNSTIGETGTYGIKNSNAHQQCPIIGGTISDAGLAGVVITGQATASPVARDTLVANLTIKNTGSSGLWSASNPSGVLLEASADDNTYPRGVRVRNVGVVDDQGSPTTIYGFRAATTSLDNSIDHTCWSGSNIANFNSGFTILTPTIINTQPVTVDFNSANTDTAVSIVIPQGYTRYVLQRVIISNASASLTTATCSMWTATGGGGTNIVASGTAITVSTAAEDTNNNTQQLTIVNRDTKAMTSTVLYFRVQTPQGSAATGKVTVAFEPVS